MQQRFDMRQGRGALWISLALVAMLVLAARLFWPATHGPFVFDDFPNLQNLAELEGTPDLPHLRRYLAAFNGNPGRPLATLSFVIEDAAWPTDPAPYKRNNILWHLLAGVLVFALARRLARLVPRLAARPDLVALVATAMWLLHPMQLSATMLVVQRMAILSSIFMLAGLLAYLRCLRSTKLGELPRVVLAGGALSLSALLAMLCKENGVLVFAYATALNLTLLRPTIQAFKPAARRLLLWGAALPLLVLALAALWLGPSLVKAYSGRDFTLGERLLTQPRALMDYLGNILLPRLGGQGVFHDQFTASHGLLQPTTTLPALLAVAALIGSAVALRKRLPLYGFAVLWFFAGHLIESTVIPLELYFEHRNYLPMLGPLFMVAGLACTVPAAYRRGAYLALGLWLVMAAGITAYSATIWGDRGTLAKVWLRENPDSVRAIQMVASYEMDEGQTDAARRTLEQGIARLPDHTELRFQRALVDCFTVGLTASQWSELERLSASADDISTISDAVGLLGKQSRDGRCHDTMPAGEASKLMMLLLENPRYGDVSRSVIHYELAKQALVARDLDGLMHHLDLAYELRPSPLIAREQAIYLLTAGLPDDALHYLDISEHTQYPWIKRWLLDMHTFNAPLRQSAIRMKAQQDRTAPQHAAQSD